VIELIPVQTYELAVCIMLTVAVRNVSRGSVQLTTSPPACLRHHYPALSALKRSSSDRWCPALIRSL